MRRATRSAGAPPGGLQELPPTRRQRVGGGQAGEGTTPPPPPPPPPQQQHQPPPQHQPQQLGEQQQHQPPPQHQPQQLGEQDEDEQQQPQPALTPVNSAELNRLASYAEKKALFECGVAQVGNEGFAVATTERVALLKLSAFKAAFTGAGPSGDAPAPGKKRSETFVERWLRDPDRRTATKLTYIPYGPGRPMPPVGELNTFRGFDATVTTRAKLAPLRIAALVKPWRALGVQLCEGFESKFDLLEQWLAHMVQLPHERSNIAFGIVGARQGVGKNAFFAPVRKILGPHNSFEDGDIHKFVESYHEKADLAGRLLCIHDEANPQSTKLFHDRLKVTVTGETAWSRHKGEVDHQLPAHHRFVALSNNLDGLYVDFKSGNRRFVLLKPTTVFATPQPDRDRPEDLLTPEARLVHNQEYTKRFVSPGENECISALFQHLARLPVKYRSTAQWEEACTKVMAASPLSRSIEPTPGHVEFLYSITREPEDPQRPPIEGDKKSGLRKVKQVGWKKTHAHDDDYDEDLRDDPSYNLNRPYHEIEISREELFKLFSGTRYAESGSSQHKFSLDVQTIFARAASIETYGSHMVTPPGLEHDFKSEGVRYWRFSTQRLRAQLEQDHPGLKLRDKAPDIDASGLSEAITGGGMTVGILNSFHGPCFTHPMERPM